MNRVQILTLITVSVLTFSPLLTNAQSVAASPSNNQEGVGGYIFGTLISADEQFLTALGSLVTRVLGKTRILGGTFFGSKGTGNSTSSGVSIPVITPSAAYTGVSGCSGACVPAPVTTSLQGSGFLEPAIGNFDEPRNMWVESGCAGGCSGLNYTIGVIAVDGDRAQIDHVDFYLEGATVTVTKPSKNARTGAYGYVVNVQSGNCNGDVVLYADIYPTNGYVRRVSLPLTINTQTSSSIEQTASCNVAAGSTQSGLIAHPIRYIDPAGSDSNNGQTPATAWATFNHAENMATGSLCGMNVYVTSGSYPGPTYLEDNSDSGNSLYPCRMIQFLPATPGQYYSIGKTTRSSGGVTYLGIHSGATLFDSAVFLMQNISALKNKATGETIVLRNVTFTDSGGPTGKTFAEGLVGMQDGILGNQPQLFMGSEGRFNAIIDSPITSNTVQAAGVDFVRNWKVNLSADTVSEFANASNQPFKTIINMVSIVVNLFWQRFAYDQPQDVTIASFNYCTNTVYIPSAKITIPAGSTIITLNVPTPPEVWNGGMQGNGNNQYVVFGSGGSLFNGALMAFNGFGNNTGAEVDGSVSDPTCGGAVLIPDGTGTPVPFITVNGSYTTDAWARTSFPNDIKPVPGYGAAAVYNAGTKYSSGAVVSESGIYFVSMSANNTGNDPILDDGFFWKNVVAAPLSVGQTVFPFIAFHDDLGQFTGLNSTALNYDNIIFQGSYLRGVDVQPFLYQPGALAPVMTASQSGATFTMDPMSYASGSFVSGNTTILWNGSPALKAYTPGYFGNQIGGSLSQGGVVSMSAGCSTQCPVIASIGAGGGPSLNTKLAPEDTVSITGEPGVWKVNSVTDSTHMTVSSINMSTSVAVSNAAYAKIGATVYFKDGVLAGQEFPLSGTQTTTSTVVLGDTTAASNGDTAYITPSLEPGDFVQWQNCVGNTGNNKAYGAVIARPTPYTATLNNSITCGAGSTYTVAKSMMNVAYIGTILATNTGNERTFYDLGQFTHGHKNIVFIGSTIYGTFVDFRTTQAAYGYADFASFDSVWSTTQYVGGNALSADGVFPTQLNFDNNTFFNSTASGFTKGTNAVAKVWASGIFDSGTTTAKTYKPLDTSSTGLQQRQRGLVGNAHRANGCPIYPYSQDGRAIGCGTAIPNPFVGAEQP